jgi:hypothetical protein
MRRLIAFGVGAAALLVGAFARADEPWATGLVVPTIQLSGSTSGKGQISAGVDFRTSQSETLDVFLNPTFTIANSDGVGSILKATSADGAAGPTTFSGSLSASFASMSTRPLGLDAAETAELHNTVAQCLVHMGAPYPSPDEEKFATAWLGRAAKALLADTGAANLAAHQALATTIGAKISERYRGCTFAERDADGPAHCQCASPNKSCDADAHEGLATDALKEMAKTCWGAATETPVCKWLKDSSRASIPAQEQELCAAGKQYYGDSKVLKNKSRELRRLLYPQHLVSLGLTYGAGVFKYLDGTGASLKASSSTRSSVSGNVLYTFVQSASAARFTFELPLGFKSTWTESTTIAFQCSPVGTLKGKSVETCDQTPMGEPTRGLQLSGAALLGIAAVAESDLWRAAIGPVFMVDFASKAKTTYQIGGEIPLYLSLLKSAGYEGDYEGMVRIMPTVLAEQTKDAKGVSTVGVSASLSIALLGKRKMFGSQLYWP